MSRKWLRLTIGAVLLVALAPAAAETVYSDGWVPPRLVDGVWVTSGVSDEVVREYAASLAQENQQQARWQQWCRPDAGSWMFGGPAMGFNPPNFQQMWMGENPMPESLDGGLGLATGRFVGPRVFGPTQHNGPTIDGLDIWSYADRMNNKYHWLTGQNQYPPWVLR